MPEAVMLREAKARFRAAAAEAKDASHQGAAILRVAGDRLRQTQNELQAAQKAFDAATGEPKPVGLTLAVTEEVSRLFPVHEREEVINLLDRSCGRTLPFHRKSSPEAMEHIRLCVLQLSNGDMAKLRQWIEHANVDWRDVLTAASMQDQRR